MYARKALVLTGAALAGTLLVAACGSSSPKAASPSSSGGGSSAPAVGAPIIIGNVGTYSGPIGSSNTATVPILKAWAAEVNASGGINGHPIKLETADDQTSPSANLTAIQSQVENDHVIAFVSNMEEATAGAAQSYLEGKQIPVVGGDGNLPAWHQSPVYFPTGASTSVVNYGQIKTAQSDGVKKLAIWYCTDSPTCKIFADQQTKIANSLGLPLSGEQPISLAQASFTAPCLAAKNAGADAVTPNVDSSTFQRIVKSCQSVGYNPTYTTSTNSLSSTFSSLPSGVKAVGDTAQFPYFLTSGSDALTAYAGITKDYSANDLNSSTSQAWAAVNLFEAAAKAGIPAGGTPTSAEVLTGLLGLKATTLGGLTIPLSFIAGQPAPAGSCWFTTLFSGGKFTSPSGLTPVCTTATIPN